MKLKLTKTEAPFYVRMDHRDNRIDEITKSKKHRMESDKRKLNNVIVDFLRKWGHLNDYGSESSFLCFRRFCTASSTPEFHKLSCSLVTFAFDHR